MISLMIAAESSNSGKTTVTCGLLSLLKKQGLSPCSFKCGPDYIDPMFHRSVLGVDSHNLDIHLAGEEGMKEIFRRYSAGHDAVVCEGVMGMYDGIRADSPVGSAWHIADLLDLPVLLVVKPKGIAMTLAAVVKGLATFRENSHLAAVVLNDCSKAYFDTYGPAIEREAGVPVIGYVPHIEEAVLESRHLGLLTAGEVKGLKEKIDILSEKMGETIDIERLKELCRRPEEVCGAEGRGLSRPVATEQRVRLAVAKDAAFNFIYEEGMDALRDAGAEICFFSPLRDKALPPEVSGLYLPGGYPELHAEELSANSGLKEEIRRKMEEGMPTVAECGGYMYLAQALEDGKGRLWPMMGVAPGECRNTGKLVRFGYGTLKAREETLLLGKGDTMPEHEFHHWDSDNYGEDLILTKASTGKEAPACFATPTLYAGYSHIYFAYGDLAQRFVSAMEDYRDAGKVTKSSTSRSVVAGNTSDQETGAKAEETLI